MEISQNHNFGIFAAQEVVLIVGATFCDAIALISSRIITYKLVEATPLPLLRSVGSKLPLYQLSLLFFGCESSTKVRQYFLCFKPHRYLCYDQQDPSYRYINCLCIFFGVSRQPKCVSIFFVLIKSQNHKPFFRSQNFSFSQLSVIITLLQRNDLIHKLFWFLFKSLLFYSYFVTFVYSNILLFVPWFDYNLYDTRIITSFHFYNLICTYSYYCFSYCYCFQGRRSSIFAIFMTPLSNATD